MTKSSGLLILLTMTCGIGVMGTGCSGDDTSQADAGEVEDASTDHARDVQVEGSSGNDAGDSGNPGDGDAGSDSDSDAASCGVPVDGDPNPKVRLINVLYPAQGYPAGFVGSNDPPSLSLYVNDSPVTGLTAVPSDEGASSVTKYAKITAGDIAFSVKDSLAASDAGTDGGPMGVTISADIMKVENNTRLTIIAIGQAYGVDADKPRLLVLKENFASISCDEAALRFVAADSAFINPSFYVDKNPSAAAAPLFGAASDEAGVVVSRSIKLIAATPDVLNAFGPTGQTPFSVAPDVLGHGRPYFVIETGEPRRATDDKYTQGLLVVPAGDDSPATFLKRDPLVYLLHASPPDTPANLNVYSGTEQLAINMKFGRGPTYLDLTSAGATLTFVDPAGIPDGGLEDGGIQGSVVLDGQSTGALDPGGIYLGVLMGKTGETGVQQLQTKFWKVQPTLAYSPIVNPDVMFINASPTAPALDFGYTDETNTFVSVATSIDYGSSTPNTGTDFPVPLVEGNHNVALRVSGGEDLRVGASFLKVTWFAAVLTGDWNMIDGDPGASHLTFLSNFGGRPVSTPNVPMPLPAP